VGEVQDAGVFEDLVHLEFLELGVWWLIFLSRARGGGRGV
jgi:hypothetical protein